MYSSFAPYCCLCMHSLTPSPSEPDFLEARCWEGEVAKKNLEWNFLSLLQNSCCLLCFRRKGKSSSGGKDDHGFTFLAQRYREARLRISICFLLDTVVERAERVIKAAKKLVMQQTGESVSVRTDTKTAVC